MTSLHSGGWRPLRANEWGLLAAIVVVVAVTSVVDGNHNYWSDPWGSFVDIARQTVFLGIFALGAAVVIISGGIDLSSGSMIALSGTVCGTIMVLLAPTAMDAANANSSEAVAPLSLAVIGAAIAGTILVGFLVGSLHAWLITVVKLPPFIATLATLVGLRSLARVVCYGVTELVYGEGHGTTQISFQDERFLYIATSIWIPAVLFCVVAAFTWILLSRTVVGRHIYAIGGNEQAARLSGIRTERVKWLTYCISAVTAAIAGIVYAAQVSTAEPDNAGITEELNAIAAAVVGGCSLQGGVGTVPGTILGIVFMRCVIDGIGKTITTGATKYEGLVVGVVVVIAVAFSQVRAAARQGKRFFPGLLGWVTIATLGILAGTVMTMVAGKTYGAGTLATVLVALTAVKLWESTRADR